MKIDFCSGWIYYRADRAEQRYKVTLPHDAMLTEERVFGSKGGKNTGWYEGGDYIYEKEFVVPEIYEGQTVTLEFEGVYHNADIFLNGRQAGSFGYGYNGFLVCADSLLGEEKNHLMVIAHNSDQPNSRWYTGTGMYRPVTLHILPEKHFVMESIRITTVKVERFGLMLS